MNSIKKIGFFTAFILPALVVTGFYLGDWWNFLSLGFAFGVITIIDHLAGTSTHNVASEDAKRVGDEFYYRFITYAWTFVQIGFIGWAFYVISSGEINTIPEWFGFVIGAGLVTGGIGITIAHELGHKKSKLERLYGRLLLMTVCYMHFYIEHNRGHHVYVATPEDPATAKKKPGFLFLLDSLGV